MSTRGIVIGKFYPPHRGHKHLINAARAQVDELTVVVCEHPAQSISGATRKAWLEEIHPDVDVIVVPDIVPNDDSEGWARYAQEFLDWCPDVVFTSEAYGDEYARFLGARHVLVDRDRAIVPISSTRVREDPLSCWEYLEPCVRAHYAVRVVVVGSESTGTTTMARALAEHYRTAWVPEVGRYYSEGKMTGESEWRSEEFVFIAQQQNALEDELARHCDRVLFCDTDSFATSVWHERYMGCPSPEVEALARDRNYALYLLTDVGTPFVQDGVRDGEHLREWMHDRFIEELEKRHKPCLLLAGPHEARLKTAIDACDKLLTARTVAAPL